MAIAYQWTPSYSEERRTKYTVHLIIRKPCKRSVAETDVRENRSKACNMESGERQNDDITPVRALSPEPHTQLGPFWATPTVHIIIMESHWDDQGFRRLLISRLPFGSFVAISVLAWLFENDATYDWNHLLIERHDNRGL